MKNIKYLFILVASVVFFGCSNPSSSSESEKKEEVSSLVHTLSILVPETNKFETNESAKVCVNSTYNDVYIFICFQFQKNKKIPNYRIVESLNNGENIPFVESSLAEYKSMGGSNNLFLLPDTDLEYHKYYKYKLPKINEVNNVFTKKYDFDIKYVDNWDKEQTAMKVITPEIVYFPLNTTWYNFESRPQNTNPYSGDFYPKDEKHFIKNNRKLSNLSDEEKTRLRNLHENNLDDYLFRDGKDPAITPLLHPNNN